MSSLLERHEGCRALMEQGELVSDSMVRRSSICAASLLC